MDINRCVIINIRKIIWRLTVWLILNVGGVEPHPSYYIEAMNQKEIL